MKHSSKTKNRLKGSIVAVIVLAICLCITTYAIVCTFFADGTELASDALKNYIDVYSPQALDFNMSIDGRTLTADDVFIDV